MRNYIIISLVGLAAVFSSCDDQLTLPPRQSVDQDLALSNDANVKRVLTGAYSEIRSASLYGGRIQLYAEMLGAGGEVRWEGTFNQPREMYNKQIFVNNSFVEGTWAAAYRAINVSNNVLSALDVVNEADRGRVEGEALFIRASMYFELVKFFGQPYSAGNTTTNLGVPLVLTPTRVVDEESFVSRSTVEEVYQQILNDLERAESLLPATNGFFARNYVVSAQLSRVYLQMGKYAEARDAADRAIAVATANGKAILPDYMSAFNTDADSPEDIFAIQVNTQDPTNEMFLYYSLPEFGARGGDVAILDSHIENYEADDERLDQFFFSAGEFRTAKWRDQFKNVKVIRLAELYLTRAEANFRAGTSVGASPLEDLNRIRTRVGLAPLPEVTLEAILRERKVELAHEGQIIHDIKRTQGIVKDNSSETVFNFDDPRMVFPIPQREMDANPNLVQNPGYGG